MEQGLTSEGFKAGLQSLGPGLFPFPLFVYFSLGGALLDPPNCIFYSPDTLTIGDHLKEWLLCLWREGQKLSC